MEESQKVIYIDKNDEITEIVSKIQEVSGRLVTLVVPKEAIVLQDVVNLKILQKKAEDLGKEISISKTENRFPTVSGASISVRQSRNSGVTSKLKTHGKVLDMVNRGGTVDLRNLVAKKAEVLPEQNKEDYDTINHPIEEKNSFPVDGSDSYFEKSPVLEKKEDSELYESEDSQAMPQDEPDKEFWEEKNRKIVDEKKLPIFEDAISPENNLKEIDHSRLKKSDKRRISLLPTISSRFFAIFILICVLTAGFALFFILPKADIHVVLKSENVKGDFSFKLDENIVAPDQENGLIPAKSVQIKSEKSQTYKATGKKTLSEKATGSIVVYNECSTGTQTLVANTRFLSKEGKVFRVEEGVTVPGFTKPEDTVIAGQKTIKVIAEEAGESYNIGATTFTIPKLQELASWKYSCLYARSSSAMTGGIEKEVAYVSQTDYDNAKNDLLKLVQSENDQKINEQKNDNTVVVSNDEDEGKIVTQSSVNVGGVGEEFILTVSLEKDILEVDKNNINGILEENMIKLANSGSADPVKGSLVYDIIDFSDENGKVSVKVSASEDFVFKMEEEQIKDAVAGKDESEFSGYFNNIEGVGSVDVNLWPFWVKKVPSDYNKINITIDISDSI